jgi:hypothetical protein
MHNVFVIVNYFVIAFNWVWHILSQGVVTVVIVEQVDEKWVPMQFQLTSVFAIRRFTKKNSSIAEKLSVSLQTLCLIFAPSKIPDLLFCACKFPPVLITPFSRVECSIPASYSDRSSIVDLFLVIHAVSFSESLVFAGDCCCVPFMHPCFATGIHQSS